MASGYSFPWAVEFCRILYWPVVKCTISQVINDAISDALIVDLTIIEIVIIEIVDVFNYSLICVLMTIV